MKPSDVPLYEIKANLFRALAHPVRIRVLELLVAADGEVAVAHLLPEIGIEPSHLSGHLAVLRRHGVVTSRRVASTVYYRVGDPAVAALLTNARTFLLGSLAGSVEQLDAARSLPTL